ncbi:MAG: ribosomal protein S6 modification protein [Gammaproteobacteria bacterium RIFCSPHIGHO2_12_FULL_38_11]|nr:MAG: ribosomal protein S6 modification protein [Gammaproteobacteria bacterium RIFCSPHIGHO2_12_FULL_38_11]
MKIAILSRNKSLYSTHRLVEAATERGHDVTVIDYLRCYMNITAEQPSIQYKGHHLANFDAIIPRIGANRTFYGAAILRQFETMGTYSINSSLAITRSRDKLRSQQLLVMKGVNMPITGFAHATSDINDLIDLVGGPPLIIKLIEGTQGVGVVLAETRKAAESVTQTLRGLRANIIIQEFIAESKGADIRCFVIGDKVIASMQRKAIAGEFRANIHRGGKAEPVRISKVERDAVIKAAKIMGLGMAGVDLIRSRRGPLILEINSSPGLEGIETATEKDIASAIIKHIEKNAKPIGPRSRYQG